MFRLFLLSPTVENPWILIIDSVRLSEIESIKGLSWISWVDLAITQTGLIGKYKMQLIWESGILTPSNKVHPSTIQFCGQILDIWRALEAVRVHVYQMWGALKRAYEIVMFRLTNIISHGLKGEVSGCTTQVFADPSHLDVGFVLDDLR